MAEEYGGGGSGKQRGGGEDTEPLGLTVLARGKSSESKALYRHFQESMCPCRTLWFPVNPSLTENPLKDKELA